jgi:hypothetical protein
MKRAAVLALAIGLFTAQAHGAAQGRSGRGGGPPTSPLSSLLALLRAETNPAQAVEDVSTIWATDRWFTFPKFEETARNVAAIMQRAGLEEVEIGRPPADGVSQGGFWTLPLAWDVTVGTLEIVDPVVPPDQRILADYQKVPASLCMWSGPTPAGGVMAEVVLNPGNQANVDLTGKLVLGGSKAAVLRAGGLGLISENTENPALADERGWVNAFGDNGWSFTKGSTPLVCFSITPNGSKLLRSLLARGPVKVRANVDSRYYDGVYPYVTGVIRGTDGASAEEVLSLGHLYELGAHDNATGVAAIIGAAETVNRLINEGRLPRPRRTIRVLAMGECYGTNWYLEHHMDRARRTIAAMNIDSPAGPQHLAGTEHTWILNPHSATSYVDAFALRLAEEYYPSVNRPWRSTPHQSSTDNYLGDPSIGIPTIMPRGGYGVPAHHNSGDTPATVDPRSMRDLMVMNGAFTYFLASAGSAERRWMADVALTRGFNQVAAAATQLLDRAGIATTGEALGRLLAHAPARIAYTVERESRAVREAAALDQGLADLAAFGRQQTIRVARRIQDRAAELQLDLVRPIVTPPDPEAETIVVRRTRIGTITLDNLPRDRREGFPAASFWGVPVSALYWCDGARTLAEVIRLTELEMGPQTFDFVGYFRFLERHGYVEFVKPDGAAGRPPAEGNR